MNAVGIRAIIHVVAMISAIFSSVVLTVKLSAAAELRPRANESSFRPNFGHANYPDNRNIGDGTHPVLPGQPVEPFSVETPTGRFSFDPATSERPAVIIVFNPEDPFQRAMWDDWSLQMFLRHAPLFAADYLFVPYTANHDAAVDLSYYMYSQMIVAARDVYGSNETTDEELRRRVFVRLHFVSTPGLSISPQLTRLLDQWKQDMKVMTARRAECATCTTFTSTAVEVHNGDQELGPSRSGMTTSGRRSRRRVQAIDGADDGGGDGDGGHGRGDVAELTVSRLDAWYGWLPSPEGAKPSPAPLIAFDGSSSGGGGGSPYPCDPRPSSARNNDDDGSNGGKGPGRGGSNSNRNGDNADAGSSSSSSSSSSSKDLAGAWVLVANVSRGDRADCSYADVIVNMQRAGALGVIFLASPGLDVEIIAPPGETEAAAGPYSLSYKRRWGWQQPGLQQGSQQGLKQGLQRRRVLEREGEQGSGHGLAQEDQQQRFWDPDSEQPYIPATMVDYYDGLDVVALVEEAAEHNDSATVELGVQQVPAGWLVLDPAEGLAEAGWAQLPMMMHAGWAAWWHLYLGRLRQRLRAGGGEENVTLPLRAPLRAGEEDGSGEGAKVEEKGHHWGLQEGREKEEAKGLRQESRKGEQLQEEGPRQESKQEGSNEEEGVGGRVITVFRDQPFPGPHGASAIALLPRHPSRRYGRLELDFALGCPGPLDASCPSWDHMVQLFVCCDPRPERCTPCPTTLWLQTPGAAAAAATGAASPATGGAAQRAASRKAAAAAAAGTGTQHLRVKAVEVAAGTPGERQEAEKPRRCGLELGRWATPFRRRVGHWLTDVTPLMAVLGEGGRCTFTVQTAPWADGNWTASLSLRFKPGRSPTAISLSAASYPSSPSSLMSTSTSSVPTAVAAGTAVAAILHAEAPAAAGGSWDRQEKRRDAEEGIQVSTREHLEQEGEQQQQQSGLQQPEMQQQQQTDSAAFVARRSTAALPGAVRLLPAGGTAAANRHVHGHGGAADANPAASSGISAALPRRPDDGASPSTSGGASTVTSDGNDRPLRPAGLLPLFSSAPFDSSYNKAREPVYFATPSAVRAATIVSYITGHGSDASGCAEFCPTSHHFFVNGREVAMLNFTDAATEWGCADAVLYGSVPNQHGTWFYGRGGWCDGAAVRPWVADISDVLLPPVTRSNNSVLYKGLYGGVDPVDPPEGVTAAYIMMQSILVFYS